MRKITFLLVSLLLMGFQVIQAQKVITGKVTGADDGTGIPGVQIVVKGTLHGTTSDIDGKYRLTVPEKSDILVFTFVGMKSQEVKIGGKNIIDVVMVSDVMNLDAVVVTAIGIKKAEKNLGYSATQINSDEIMKSRDRSPMNALQGKVAGVNISTASSSPGASTRVISRGFSSLTGSNQALYVVDGVPINNSSIGSTDLNGGTDFGNRGNDINPDDIESISFLKGSSATILYGSRAANGVIVITTKKGKDQVRTTKKKGADVTFTSTFFTETPLRLPTYQNEFGEGFNGKPDVIENTSWGPKFDGVNRVWGHVVNNQQQIKPYVALPNNVRDFFDVGTSFDNSISIANSSEKSSYFFSYSNINADGIFPTDADSYKRNTLSLRGTAKLDNNFTSSGSISYVKKKSKFVPTGQDQSVYDNIMQTPRDISIVDQEDYNNKWYNLDNYYNGYAANPYYVLNEHGNDFNEDRVFGNIGLDYKFNDWMNASWKVGSDVANSQLKEWRAITNYVRNDYSDDPGRVTEQTYYNREFNSDLILNVNHSINQDIEFSGLLGWNVNQRNTKTLSTEVIGLNIPYFYNLSNSSATPSVAEATMMRRLYGIYLSADFNYKKYLNLQLNARNDWSSTLPEANRSFFYPGVNASFVFTEFYPEITNIIPFGKVRMGWAQVGNDANPYLIFNSFTQANYADGYRGLDWPLGGINALTVGNTIGNPNLKPEITSEFEIGTDLRFLNNRIGIDFTYYNKITTDLIYPVPLAYSSGYKYQTMNLGKISNKGVEILIKGTPLKNANFKWEISVNFSKNYNKLEELNAELTKVDLGGTSSIGFVAVPGQPLGMYEGAVALTDPQGHIVVDGSGLPVANPVNQILGSSQYDWMAGISNNLSYKNLSLSFSFDIRQGGLMYSRTKEMMYFAGTAPATTYNDRQPFIIPNSVQAIYDANGAITGYTENTVAISHESATLYQYYDQKRGAGNFSREWLIDKSFIKLREVVLTYTFPKKWLAKTPFGDASFSIIGRNLLLFTPEDNKFIDPELTTFGNDLNADYGEYSAAPTTRSIGASLRFTF
ncbi:MAG: SusC/RagA family TonB-linked outer membrane protein [Bacteroidetes bacterium]|nr:SusC/RagA family TonB-linked outer membrane protein [Bacteroidota bacterium]